MLDGLILLIARSHRQILKLLSSLPGATELADHLVRYWPELTDGAGWKVVLSAFTSTLSDLAGT